MDRGIKGPLLGEAKGALIHVSGGEDLTPGEAMRAAESVTESMGEEALGI
jgi:cell division GTPase FtsZ